MSDQLAILREQHLVETDWVADQLAKSNSLLRIVDMRGQVRISTSEEGVQLSIYKGSESEYRTSHLPGAIYLNWTQDIVDENDPTPVQLASPEKLRQVLEERGIGDEHTIVAYDSTPAAQIATRFWWVMRCYGNSNVRVLNGGWNKWLQEGRQVTDVMPNYPKATFTPVFHPEWVISADALAARLNSPDLKLLDARDTQQYSGAVRRGQRGGHIPGALSLPRELFLQDGKFRPSEELVSLVKNEGFSPDQNIVAYCNGGVAATSVLFALSMIGFGHLTNYDGSWNEWTLRKDLPVE